MRSPSAAIETPAGSPSSPGVRSQAAVPGGDLGPCRSAVVTVGKAATWTVSLPPRSWPSVQSRSRSGPFRSVRREDRPTRCRVRPTAESCRHERRRLGAGTALGDTGVHGCRASNVRATDHVSVGNHQCLLRRAHRRRLVTPCQLRMPARHRVDQPGGRRALRTGRGLHGHEEAIIEHKHLRSIRLSQQTAVHRAAVDGAGHVRPARTAEGHPFGTFATTAKLVGGRNLCRTAIGFDRGSCRSRGRFPRPTA